MRRLRAIFMFPDGADFDTLPDDGWVVGDRNGNDFTINRWNNPTAGQWNNQSFTDAVNRQRLNAVYILDTDGNGLGDDGWVVGDLQGNNLTILRWNHACGGGAATGTWAVCSFDPGAAFRQNLNGVFMLSGTDGWAVGNGGLMLHWNGTQWSVIASPTTNRLNKLFLLSPQNFFRVADWQEVY